jgi:hypothetical protein
MLRKLQETNENSKSVLPLFAIVVVFIYYMQIIFFFGDTYFIKIFFLKIKTDFFENLYNIKFKKRIFKLTG